jgi:hypothetical protein
MKNTRSSVTHRALIALFTGVTALFASPVDAIQVFVPDNGFGTAQMPILADYASETQMHIVDGLGGSTIQIDAVLEAPAVFAEQPGGTLGGTKSAGGGSGLFTWQMQGTGAFAGYNRTLSFPINAGPGGVASFADPAFNVTAADFEVHAEPRTNNAPMQSFDTDMFRLFNQRGFAQGDPDFDLLRVTAGTDFGMPSPGHTTLLQTGPNWEVDSFFDVIYRIDFVGNPTGPFAGRSGSTTHTVRFSLGEPIVPEPTTATLLMFGLFALSACKVTSRPRRERAGVRVPWSDI